MSRVVGIRFKAAGKVYYFDPGELVLTPGEGAVVETARGVELGTVTSTPREVPEEEIKAPLKKVLRKATPEDLARRKENEEKARRAFTVGQQKIAAHGLPMKLVEVEYTLDGSKIIFYFTAENRVDFRELVKDLASSFRTRIELRQIGVRDEAKLLGGLGPCGRQLCCQAFLGDFVPVSIKMAKEQNLSLNPTKISGICGRLMCCLNFESEAYREAKRAAAAQSGSAAAAGQPSLEAVPAGEGPDTPGEAGRSCAACPAASGAAPCAARRLEEAEPVALGEPPPNGETPAQPSGRKRRRRRTASQNTPTGEPEAGQPAPSRELGAQAVRDNSRGRTGSGPRGGRSGPSRPASQGNQASPANQTSQKSFAAPGDQGGQGGPAGGNATGGGRPGHRRRRRKARPGGSEGRSGNQGGSPAE